MTTPARREVRRILVRHNVKRYEYLKPSEAKKEKANPCLNNFVYPARCEVRWFFKRNYETRAREIRMTYFEMVPEWPNGGVRKTSIRRFESDPSL